MPASKARPKKQSKPKEIHLYVGTRKGGFLLRSDLKRKNWKISGPFFAGSEVTNLSRDPRTGKLWAAVVNGWFGADLQVSTDGGKKWEKSNAGIGFDPERKLNVARVWKVTPDRDSRPNVLWCGVDPGGLFRSDNGGKDWYEVAGLTQHPTSDKWNAGGGGKMVHAILPDPWKPNRVYVGISAAGCFRSDDDGKTWAPFNKGVLAEFQPDKYPVFGQCVHSMGMSPTQPDLIFQQNHCGVYSTEDAGANWIDRCKGLPSRFGFPMAVDKHEKQTIYVIPENGAERRYVCDAKLVVYRSTNGGAKWKKLTKGLPQENAYTQVLRHGMTTDPMDDAGVYFGTTVGELFYSRNGGDSWQTMQTHLPPILAVNAYAV